LYNYKTWCNVSVNGTSITTEFDAGPPFNGSQQICVAADQLLSVTPYSSRFELGAPPSLPFISGTNATTDDDAGITSTATVAAATGAACVFICCPIVGVDAGAGACQGLTNPCTTDGG
jgi:hypothetical protein